MVEVDILLTLLQLVALALPAVAIFMQVMLRFAEHRVQVGHKLANPSFMTEISREDAMEQYRPQKSLDIRFASLSVIAFLFAGFMSLTAVGMQALDLTSPGAVLLSGIIEVVAFMLSLLFTSLAFGFLGTSILFMLYLTPERVANQ